jgi:exopolyphosphatase/guanosine-5'-triphosphate,3'-diphosphate pyrophosphatase
VGTAGTVTTLGALDLELTAYDPLRVQGHRLTAAAIRRQLARLGGLHAAERARLPGLEPGRADLIVPGIAVVLAVLDGLGLDALLVSDQGLREGILLDAVG